MKNQCILLVVIFFLISLHAAWQYFTRFQLPVQWIQKRVMITGVVASIPIKKFHSIQFQLKTQSIHHQKIHTILLLSWYSHAPKIFVGDRWRINATLKPPVGTHNPGGFNYETFLLSKNIAATGSVHFGKLLHRSTSININIYRQHIENTIDQSIHDKTLAAFISALCVGLRDGLTENDWTVFQKTGTNHLVAIAGLHIGFVAGAFYFLTNQLWRLSSTLLLFYPAKKAAEIASLIGAFLYTLLSGFAIPAQRASIMLFFLLIGEIFQKPLSLWRRLLVAASIILFLYPASIIEASFWLSFTSMIMIGWVMQGRLVTENHLKSTAKMQWGIIIGLFPLMIFFFQQISTIAFFTNSIAIPWVGFIILPIGLCACFCHFLHLKNISMHLFYLAGKCLSPLWLFLQKAASWKYAGIHAVIFHPWILIFAMIACLFLLAPRYFPLKYLGCFGFLPLIFYHPEKPPNHTFTMTVIDVGQGLSVLVQTSHHVMLYDTGAHFPGGFDYGESVVTPFLRMNNIHTINRLEISHGDNDHSGGAQAILKNFNVLSVDTSAPKLIAALHANYCNDSQQWTWDGVTFTTLNPHNNTDYEDNNSSCVIKIDNGQHAVLLTGDIQQSTENKLIRQYGAYLHADVLLSPHHGSRTSSSRNFLTVVKPKIVIISAGKYNRYHLPAKSIVARYHEDHLKVFDTAEDGAVVVKMDKNVTVTRYRSCSHRAHECIASSLRRHSLNDLFERDASASDNERKNLASEYKNGIS